MSVDRLPSPSPFAAQIGFSAAVTAGPLVFLAGKSAIDADGGIVGGDDPHVQAIEALRKVAEALEELGGGLADVVSTRIYLADVDDWPAVGRAHGEAFAGHPPASTMVVAGLLDPRMRVEIEAIAYIER